MSRKTHRNEDADTFRQSHATEEMFNPSCVYIERCSTRMFFPHSWSTSALNWHTTRLLLSTEMVDQSVEVRAREKIVDHRREMVSSSTDATRHQHYLCW